MEALYISSETEALVNCYICFRPLTQDSTSCCSYASNVSAALCPHKYFYPLLLNYRKSKGMTFNIIPHKPEDLVAIKPQNSV